MIMKQAPVKKYYMPRGLLDLFGRHETKNISATDYVRIYNAITGCDMTEDEFKRLYQLKTFKKRVDACFFLLLIKNG